MKSTANRIILAALLVILTVFLVSGCGSIQEVPADTEYSYVNPDEAKAQTDAGIVIDGVLDEAVYQDNNWLYLHNDDGGNNVTIAMTSHYGEKGMYFVYDVTETVPIYVNLQRASYMNSCIEMYFAPSSVTSLKENSYFEVDMLPTGDMVFKKSNGKGGYVNVATTDDIMAHLGATTKGGEVNSEGCYGYNLELFIPWEYMQWLGLDAQAMKNSFVYVDPAHITSFNLTGTDTSVDRYWYFYAQQQGAGFSDVYQYFRFDGNGVLGTVPTTLTGDDHCTVTGDKQVIPGMETTVTVTPESGYAITSVLVGGEEMIEKVSFRSDGSVVLVTRAQKDGLTVTAATEAVTEGNKTLKGTITLAKPGGDSLQGIDVFYSGPTGDKPLTVDQNGSFVLSDMAQGYYVIKAEKEGYTALSQGVYLNRDMTVSLTLQYDTFYAEKGTCWLLDQQNEGILQKFGGSGYLLTTDPYRDFTFSSSFFYDEELSKEADTDFFLQQRSGMRILFSNGKYWHIDMLKENDNYILQYAKHSGDGSVFKWKTICTLSDEQIAAYCSEKGIKLTVVRSGQYAGIWLDDTLVTIEKLEDAYASCTAQLGFEYWVANRTVQEIPYSISAYAQVDVAKAVFKPAKGFDVSGQFDGELKTVDGKGDSGWIDSYNSYKELDLTLTLKDQHNSEDNYRAAIALNFENGKRAVFTLTNAHNKAEDPTTVYALQNMGDDFLKWAARYTLTEEQSAKLQSKDGLQLRIVRVGAYVDIYLDGVHAYEYDLTLDKEGKESNVAGEGAKIGLRLYGNTGENVKLPFTLKTDVDQVTVKIAEDEKNAITTDQKTYLKGETVKVLSDDQKATYITELKVDGNAVVLDEFGSYSFTAEKDSYTLSGSFADKVFNASHEWSTQKQNAGILTVPGSDGDSGWIASYGSYKDMDLRLTVRDQHTADDNFRGAVRLSFENGQYVTFSLTNDRLNDDDPSVYELQNLGGSILNWTRVKDFRLNENQLAKLQSESGVELRIVRLGDQAYIFVDGQFVHQFDLSVDKDGNPSGVADQKATVSLRMYGNTGEDAQVGFDIREDVQKVQIDMADDAVCTANAVIFKGDTVTLQPADTGCKLVSLKVDGQQVTVTDDAYSFVADKTSYTVEAVTQRVKHWQPAGHWDAAQQTEGILKKPVLDTNTGWMNTYESSYRDITVTVADQKNSDNNFNLTQIFEFTNGQKYQFRLTNADSDGSVYKLQNIPTNNTIVSGWGTIYTLSEAQKTKLCGDGITLRAVVTGSVISFYLDGVQVAERDLSHNAAGEPTQIADCGAKLSIRLYGNDGVETALPFLLGGEPAAAKIEIAETENGSITTAFADYLPGDTVTVAVAGDTGYAHDSFKVNGQDKMTDLHGNYSFTAAEENSLSAAFKASLFKDTVSGWLLENQHYGKLALTYTNANGNSNWLDFAKSYTDLDITLQAREYEDAAKPITRTAIRFMFENGKVITFSIAKNTVSGGYKYSVQSLSGDNVVSANHDFYIMDQSEIDSFRSEAGISFRVVRSGTKVLVELDGKLVVEGFDLTTGDSGITADMPMNVTIRRYDDPGIMAQYGISVSETLPQCQIVIDPAITGGTVTADKTTAKYGETVTLTLTPDSGNYQDLKLNGKDILVDWNTGSYSFTALESAYTVSGSFKQGLGWSDNSAFKLINQHKNVLALSYTGAGSGWIDVTGNYSEITVTAKDYTKGVKTNGEYFSTVVRFSFSDTERYAFRIVCEAGSEPGTYTYSYTRFGANQSLTGWGRPAGTAAITDTERFEKLQNEGLEFKLVRDGRMIHAYVGGILVESYTMQAKHENSDVVSVGIRHYGNPQSDAYEVLLPYTLTLETEA